MIAKLKETPVEILIIAAVITLSAFLRLYQISGYMTFLGDEGRDAIIVKDILVGHHIPSIGAPTSVGNIYLGPLYYYMMAMSMAIWWLNPVAAAVMVALIGVLTVVLVFYLTKKWFGFWPGIMSALLYAISPVNIVYSRSSWNPDPAPFFSLLSIYFYTKILEKRFTLIWFALIGASLSAAVQMHYLALIMVPVIVFLWIWEIITGYRSKNFLLGPLFSLVGFLLVLLPWILFDIRHGFLNSRAIFSIFLGQQSSISFSLVAIISKAFYIYVYNLISRYMTGNNILIAIIISILLLGNLLLLIRKKGKTKRESLILLAWIIIGCLGLSLYKYQLYDHYLGFLNPAPYIVFGSIFYSLKELKLKKNNLVAVVIFGAITLILIALNLKLSPLQYSPNNQLQRTQDISKFIIQESENKPFNFALLSKNNYDAAYQFYLDQYGHKPKALPIDTTGQLFVICEDNPCQPVGNPKYEIAAFGWARVETMWDVFGVKIYKLVPNPSGKPS